MKETLDKLDPNWVTKIKEAQRLTYNGNEIKKRMDVVGEEGTSLADFITQLKA
jgi:V/A-type H+-transporting ATPase subunit A